MCVWSGLAWQERAKWGPRDALGGHQQDWKACHPAATSAPKASQDKRALCNASAWSLSPQPAPPRSTRDVTNAVRPEPTATTAREHKLGCTWGVTSAVRPNMFSTFEGAYSEHCPGPPGCAIRCCSFSPRASPLPQHPSAISLETGSPKPTKQHPGPRRKLKL